MLEIKDNVTEDELINAIQHGTVLIDWLTETMVSAKEQNLTETHGYKLMKQKLEYHSGCKQVIQDKLDELILLKNEQ